jgi:phosphotransferase system HPr-like phosphotransfer protein
MIRKYWKYKHVCHNEGGEGWGGEVMFKTIKGLKTGEACGFCGSTEEEDNAVRKLSELIDTLRDGDEYIGFRD